MHYNNFQHIIFPIITKSSISIHLHIFLLHDTMLSKLQMCYNYMGLRRQIYFRFLTFRVFLLPILVKFFILF